MSLVLKNIIHSLDDAGQIKIPVSLIDKSDGKDALLIKHKVLIKANEFLSTIECPLGCGDSESVRQESSNGKPVYFVRCKCIGEYRRVDPDEVELYILDRNKFLKLVDDGTIKLTKEELGKAGSKASMRKFKNRTRAKADELTEEDVARDFGTTRQTVSKWETKQTVDGSENKSNKYGYYKSLRTNPALRGAYETLVKSVKLFLAAKAKAKKDGKRFKISFVRFNEEYLKHNQS